MERENKKQSNSPGKEENEKASGSKKVKIKVHDVTRNTNYEYKIRLSADVHDLKEII